jgi:succinate dehydrogenase / fumarate reductase iron-sulfur subunit
VSLLHRGKNAAGEAQAAGSSDTRLMNITVRVWRQPNAEAKGQMVSYEVPDVSEHMSFLEMMDVLNERLTMEGDDPIAFDHDCREGICGQCGVVINGVAHGPQQTTTCQLHMRSFHDGDVIDVEPWRADPFPVIKDLIVNRGAFDRIIQAGGFISAPTGSAPDHAFDAATCISCGACVAACPNGSAMLFTAAKVTHLGLLPQGQPERHARALDMVAQHDAEGFGGCSNIGECTAVCPKGIPFETISRLNRDVYDALVHPNS